MKTFIILVVALFSFSGCMEKKIQVVVPVKTLPSWYTNPLVSNNDTLYAVGEGSNKKDAISVALSEILATLSVSISSEFNTKTTSDTQGYNKTTSKEISSVVEKIRISNYKVTHSENFGFEKYLVAVSSDKRQLFLSLQRELEQKFESIKNRNTLVEKLNAIKQLSSYKKSINSLDGVKHMLLVMHSLNKNFDDSKYLKQIAFVENQYMSLLSKISFGITSNEDSKNLKSSISNGLSKLKYSINNINGKNHFNIFISSSTTKTSSYGFLLARSGISITVKDNTGNVVGSNKLNITGQSTQGYTIAKENIAVKLNTMIKEEGIAKVIGLDL